MWKVLLQDCPNPAYPQPHQFSSREKTTWVVVKQVLMRGNAGSAGSCQTPIFPCLRLINCVTTICWVAKQFFWETEGYRSQLEKTDHHCWCPWVIHHSNIAKWLQNIHTYIYVYVTYLGFVFPALWAAKVLGKAPGTFKVFFPTCL